MNYDYILVRYGEIALKGKNRYRFEDRLLQNIRIVLRDLNNVKVSKSFGRIFVKLNGESAGEVLIRLKKVFGLFSFSPVIRTELDMEEIKKVSLELIQHLEDKPATFKVITKRPNKQFPLKSPEVADEVGEHILINTEGIKVNVHNPETVVNIEIREEGAFIFSNTIYGIGGLPGDSSGRGLLLLSGGIDSPVAGWYAMKRGLLVEGVHFHSHPLTSEESIQKVIDLAKKLASYSGQFKVHFVPFLEVQKEIRDFAPESHNITIMRRMFLRITDRLAKERKALAIVTGESLGQVASQTLQSMNTINEVTNTPIIRPLITMDKLEIINKALEIGTYETSIRPYEDCCTLFVPRNPATKPSLRIAQKAEGYMDIESLINDAINRAIVVTITPNTNITPKDILFTEVLDISK